MDTKFKEFNKITLSDIVHGNFKIILKRYNKYYVEFYIENVLIAKIHDSNEKLYIDKLLEIIHPLMKLNDKQIEHASTINVKKITKSSIKKAIRNYLEDLLYIGVTPIELSGYNYTDFR